MLIMFRNILLLVLGTSFGLYFFSDIPAKHWDLYVVYIVALATITALMIRTSGTSRYEQD